MKPPKKKIKADETYLDMKFPRCISIHSHKRKTLRVRVTSETKPQENKRQFQETSNTLAEVIFSIS